MFLNDSNVIMRMIYVLHYLAMLLSYVTTLQILLTQT